MAGRKPSVFAVTTPNPENPAGPKYHLVARTTNFELYSQTSLGARGDTIAQALAVTCERDYSQLQQWFTRGSKSLPFQVFVNQDTHGAMHSSCGDPKILLGTNDSLGLPDDGYRMLLAAEVVEVLEAAVRLGWNCSFSNGEALSRVLAADLYPAFAAPPGLVTVPTWLYTPEQGALRENFVDKTLFTDQSDFGNGCSVLFLNWLHFVRGVEWAAIIAAGAKSLGDTYKKLFAGADGWAIFKAMVDHDFPPGGPHVTTDNPFRKNAQGA